MNLTMCSKCGNIFGGEECSLCDERKARANAIELYRQAGKDLDARLAKLESERKACEKPNEPEPVVPIREGDCVRHRSYPTLYIVIERAGNKLALSSQPKDGAIYDVSVFELIALGPNHPPEQVEKFKQSQLPEALQGRWLSYFDDAEHALTFVIRDGADLSAEVFMNALRAMGMQIEEKKG